MDVGSLFVEEVLPVLLAVLTAALTYAAKLWIDRLKTADANDRYSELLDAARASVVMLEARAQEIRNANAGRIPPERAADLKMLARTEITRIFHEKGRVMGKQLTSNVLDYVLDRLVELRKRAQPQPQPPVRLTVAPPPAEPEPDPA